jgi:VIT1/CCC1 family predicted Fe2+/Mn2+ transporter
MNTNLSESQVRTIQERLQSKPSIELRNVLEERNEQEWSPEAFEAIRRILAERAKTGEEPAVKAQPVAQQGRSERAAALSGRYRDAYRVSGVISGLGTTIKIVGAIVAAIPIVIGFFFSGSDIRFLLAALCFGGIVWALFFFVGVIVSAQGQILNACLDIAVNGSPHIDAEEKADIMSIP